MADALKRLEIFHQGKGLSLKGSNLTAELGTAQIAINCDRDTTFAIRKRYGNVLYEHLGTRQAVAGIHNYEYRDEDGSEVHQHLYVVDDGALWMKNAPDTAAVYQGGFWDKPSGDDTVDFVSFAQTPGGDCYIAEGDGRLTVWSGTDRCYAGIHESTARPTFNLVAPVGAGLTGDYYLRYTYCYRTRDGRLIESNPSGRNNPVASPTASAIEWTVYPPSDEQDGERINCIRLYRTIAGGGLSDNDFFFLHEITDLDAPLVYTDETPDTDLLLPVYLDHTPPPVGPGHVIHFNNRLFILGSKEAPQRIYYSKIGPNGEGEFEHFPLTNYIDLKVSSTSKITGGAVIHGVLVVLTEDTIHHISGIDPPVEHQMNDYVGCIAPGTLKLIGNILIFLAQTGYYSWDGSQLRYLSRDIEPAIRQANITDLRKARSVVYPFRSHYYSAYVWPDGKTRWWVYDFAVGTSYDYSTQAGSDDTATRAWFQYEGTDGAMDAVAYGLARQFGSREQMVLWGTAGGDIFRFDRGHTDNGKAIVMTYQFYVRPDPEGETNPKSQMTCFRFWTPFIDQWEGDATFGWGWWGGPFGRPGEIFKSIRIPRISGVNKRPQIKMSGYGFGMGLFRVTHDTAGEFRYSGNEFWYRQFKRGLHGTEL